jgi:diketogulonate reductase-like aldo/keto reductase
MKIKLTNKAYSPLVRGQKVNELILKNLAKKHNKTEAQILLRWSLQMVYSLSISNALVHFDF